MHMDMASKLFTFTFTSTLMLMITVHLDLHPLSVEFQFSLCYTEEASITWHHQGTQKTGNTYCQHKRPPVGTTHRPSIRHHREGSPRAA